MNFNNQTVIIPGRLAEAAFEGEKSDLIASVSEDLIIILNTKHNAYQYAKQVHCKICRMWSPFLWVYRYCVCRKPAEDKYQKLVQASTDTEWKRRKTKLFVAITTWLRSWLFDE